MSLSQAEQDEVIALIVAGKPLPLRYRASLFEDAPATELIWPGKTTELERAVLPFQSIEHIDEPRPNDVVQFDLFSVDQSTGRQRGGWTNKLIWGDNKLVLSSLAHGPLRQDIEDAGGLKLVYIDPPFDVGADFSISVEIGDAEVTKKPSIVEEVAWRDTWGHGKDSYLVMISERLRLLRELMAPDGVVAVHVDWRLSHHVRSVMDEVFGADHFINEIIWHYDYGARAKTQFGRKHDNISVYAMSDRWTFNPADVLVPFDSNMTEWRYTRGGQVGKDMPQGKIPSDVWDIKLNAMSHEHLGYPTQKPEELISRFIRGFSNPGDLVADFFVGSGTTPTVAEKLGRKWISADLGRFAIHTSRKRLIGVQRDLRRADLPYRAFEILNLGSYERQYFVGVDPSLPAEQQAVVSRQRRQEYLELILAAYSAKPSEQLPPFHGVKGGTAVFVGPLDAPVTQDDVRSAINSARIAQIERADILGFEFEMGITPAMADEARELGVGLTLRYIPDEVFDKRAVSRRQVKFYDVGYVEIAHKVSKGRKVTVQLTDFAVFYAQEDADTAALALRSGSSRIVIDNGQVVRIEKNKRSGTRRDVLTKKWSDWIDYWAVDFDFSSQKETTRLIEDGEEKQVWTGRFIFENEWQSFRTQRSRDLELRSISHTYDDPGDYRIAVKVIDIFGNDTTKIVSVGVS